MRVFGDGRSEGERCVTNSGEGRARGRREEGGKEMAIKLKTMGLSIDKISEATERVDGKRY